MWYRKQLNLAKLRSGLFEFALQPLLAEHKETFGENFMN